MPQDTATPAARLVRSLQEAIAAHDAQVAGIADLQKIGDRLHDLLGRSLAAKAAGEAPPAIPPAFSEQLPRVPATAGDEHALRWEQAVGDACEALMALNVDPRARVTVREIAALLRAVRLTGVSEPAAIEEASVPPPVLPPGEGEAFGLRERAGLIREMLSQMHDMTQKIQAQFDAHLRQVRSLLEQALQAAEGWSASAPAPDQPASPFAEVARDVVVSRLVRALNGLVTRYEARERAAEIPAGIPREEVATEDAAGTAHGEEEAFCDAQEALIDLYAHPEAREAADAIARLLRSARLTRTRSSWPSGLEATEGAPVLSAFPEQMEERFSAVRQRIEAAELQRTREVRAFLRQAARVASTLRQ